ncbi:uncharacterized protein LOC142398595 [Odontesthes bonariensis]|uniref:uncharacterized protein LOC142398595 n=1 Tax=Odontesthes bonariensis TaxID=219752 RepID=UPI003F5873B9
MSSSVVAAIKHQTSPICTWKSSDVDAVDAEGQKLAEYIATERPQRGTKPEFCKLVERQIIFGKKWKVLIGGSSYGQFNLNLEEEFSEKLQMYLLRNGMCILNLEGSCSLVIHHESYFVIVDCGTRNLQGLASETGTSVVVFNTCFNDLMIHIMNLRKSLNATEYGMSAISVQQSSFGLEACTTVIADRQVTDERHGASSSSQESVRGSFHQGDDRFKYRGLQCAAVTLVALAKHKMDSVFSWHSDTLDNVVVRGDALYTYLRENNLISGRKETLCVLDLPKQVDIDGCTLDVMYGDFVAGDVDVFQSEFIDSGAHTTLLEGLQKMCATYETCVLTINGSTCALISQNGKYAVVDSHARDCNGMVSVSGKSNVLYLNSFDDVLNYIERYARQKRTSPKEFEISGVQIDMHRNETSFSPFGSNLLKHVSVQEVLCTDKSRGQKKPQSSTSCKKIQGTHEDLVTSDVFVTNVRTRALKFNPLSKVVSEAVCKHLNVECEKGESSSDLVGDLGIPCKVEPIVGDGNCFFRAVSQAVSGTQKWHRKIRLAVVKQLERNPQMYCNILRNENSSINEYIKRSRMQYVGSWATEVEIQAAADCLGVNIVTYYIDKWLEYKCNAGQISNQCVYLQNIHGNHYETVVCVKQTQHCYGYCKERVSISQGYSVRNKTTNEPNVLESTKTANSYVLDDDSVIIHNANKHLSFNPVCTDVSKALCNKYDITFVKQDTQGSTASGPLGSVCKTEEIVKDGNSFFRAVSHVLSGSQKSHRRVRLAAVSYLEKNKEGKRLVGKGFSSVSDYVKKSCMKYVGHEASEIEMQATANALGVNLYVHNGKEWVKYGCTSSTGTNEGIYLKCDGCHFEVITCVLQGDQEFCYSFCKVNDASDTPYKHCCLDIKY